MRDGALDIVLRQFGKQASQDRRGVAGQRHRGLVQPVMLFRVGIDADNFMLGTDAPLAELDEEPRADRQHDVGLAPQVAPERQRDAERVAAVEHAAAAAKASTGACSIADSAVTSSDASCAPPPQTIIGRLAAPSSFAARRTALSVDLGLRHRQRRLHGRPGRTCPRRRWRIRARPVRAGRCAWRAAPAPLRRDACSGFWMSARVIDQPRQDAGLVADLMQMAEIAPISAFGICPISAEHRCIHGKSREQRRAGIEQSRPRHDREGLRLAGRERRAERHIGGALFVAGVDGAQPVGELE